MQRTCETCQTEFDDYSQFTSCPHEPIAPRDVLERKRQAMEIVGKMVRFAHEPDREESYRFCSSVNAFGMVHVEGFIGEFAPHLFVVRGSA